MLKYLLPLALFIALAIFLAIGLRLKPGDIPSPLIGRPAPGFVAPRLQEPAKTLAPADMKGKVWLLNVWASWCVSCRSEHPVLNALAAQRRVPIVGLNYKDEGADALNWLRTFGDPYAASIVDRDGRIGIDWGVYGVPETFLIDRRGIIRHKHTGPVTAEDIQRLLPLIEKLQQETL